MSRFINEDRLCGHKYFDSAIQLAVQAKEHARIIPNVKTNWAEARRLYNCAIADATAAIKEIEADAGWAKDAAHWLTHFKTQISQWEGEVHSMP